MDKIDEIEWNWQCEMYKIPKLQWNTFQYYDEMSQPDEKEATEIESATKTTLDKELNKAVTDQDFFNFIKDDKIKKLLILLFYKKYGKLPEGFTVKKACNRRTRFGSNCSSLI